jgi:hypothetical protein
MNINYLKDIEDIDLNSLPPIMRDEFEKHKIGFTNILDGTYYSHSVFNNLKADVFFVLKEVNQHIDFNRNLFLSNSEYNDGFWDGYYERDFLIGYPEEENKIYQIFSGIYKKANSIHSPDILRFKKNVSAYNSLTFLQKNFYDYGYEVGCFIRDWTIILNNINLFEKKFNEKLVVKTNLNAEEPQQKEINKLDEIKLHPLFDPNLWNHDCFELFKYLYDCYYKSTNRQLTNIWFYLKESKNSKYTLKATKDEYKDFVLKHYQTKITNFDKAIQKWEDKEYQTIDDLRINFEDSLK